MRERKEQGFKLGTPIAQICQHAAHKAIAADIAVSLSWKTYSMIFIGFWQLILHVVVLRVERALVIHSPHLQFLPARESNSQPLDYESDSLTIRPWLPHDDDADMQGRILDAAFQEHLSILLNSHSIQIQLGHCFFLLLDWGYKNCIYMYCHYEAFQCRPVFQVSCVSVLLKCPLAAKDNWRFIYSSKW